MSNSNQSNAFIFTDHKGFAVSCDGFGASFFNVERGQFCVVNKFKNIITLIEIDSQETLDVVVSEVSKMAMALNKGDAYQPKWPASLIEANKPKFSSPSKSK
jgi:hypothetical protein